MKNISVIVLAALALGLGSSFSVLAQEGGEDTAGFVQTVEYGNFTVSLGIADLSRVPEKIITSLRQLGIEKRVALVIVSPTAWASDSSDDHNWLIIDIGGTEYTSLDPFQEDDLAAKVETLDENTKYFIYRSSPRLSFAPDISNPLLVFFSKELPSISSWKRVVFRDILNGFEVDMHRIKKSDIKGQEQGGP